MQFQCTNSYEKLHKKRFVRCLVVQLIRDIRVKGSFSVTVQKEVQKEARIESLYNHKAGNSLVTESVGDKGVKSKNQLKCV